MASVLHSYTLEWLATPYADSFIAFLSSFAWLESIMHTISVIYSWLVVFLYYVVIYGLRVAAVAATGFGLDALTDKWLPMIADGEKANKGGCGRGCFCGPKEEKVNPFWILPITEWLINKWDFIVFQPQPTKCPQCASKSILIGLFCCFLPIPFMELICRQFSVQTALSWFTIAFIVENVPASAVFDAGRHLFTARKQSYRPGLFKVLTLFAIITAVYCVLSFRDFTPRFFSPGLQTLCSIFHVAWFGLWVFN